MATKIYLWYSSKNVKEGEQVARILGFENHGTLVPEKFDGIVVSYGAQPAEVFKWERRNIRAMINDPRKTVTYRNRLTMLKKLAQDKVATISHFPTAITATTTFESLCATLGKPFVACKENGASATLIDTAGALASAVRHEGAKVALCSDFNRPERVRVFVLNGVVMASLARGIWADDAFVNHAMSELPAVEQTNGLRASITKMIKEGIIAPKKAFWGDYSQLVTAEHRALALAAASSLGYQFCAVDMLEDGSKVINVVTTPDISIHPSLHAPLKDGFGKWVLNNSKKAKDLLREMTEAASEDEADALLEALRGIKRDAGLRSA